MSSSDSSDTFEVLMKFKTGGFAIQDSSSLWTEREKQINDSEHIWRKYSDETRDVLLKIVRKSLESLHTIADQWLPQGLLNGPAGDKIVIQMEVLLTDIEAQVDMVEETTDFEVQSMVRQIMEVLEGGESHLSDEEFIEYARQAVSIGSRLSLSEAQRLLDLVSVQS